MKFQKIESKGVPSRGNSLSRGPGEVSSEEYDQPCVLVQHSVWVRMGRVCDGWRYG